MAFLLPSSVFAQQFLPVKGIVNARDLGGNTENFVKALDSVDQQYGSMEAYLKGPMGLTDDDIRILRECYLED